MTDAVRLVLARSHDRRRKEEKRAFVGLKPEHVAATAAIAADTEANITKHVFKLTIAELGR